MLIYWNDDQSGQLCFISFISAFFRDCRVLWSFVGFAIYGRTNVYYYKFLAEKFGFYSSTDFWLNGAGSWPFATLNEWTSVCKKESMEMVPLLSSRGQNLIPKFMLIVENL